MNTKVARKVNSHSSGNTCTEQLAQGACAEQLAQSNLRRATCAEQLAQSNLRRATCAEQLAQSNLRNLRRGLAQSACAAHLAQSNLRRATCTEQLAQHALRRATCTAQVAQRNLRRGLAQSTCAARLAQSNLRMNLCSSASHGARSSSASGRPRALDKPWSSFLWRFFCFCCWSLAFLSGQGFLGIAGDSRSFAEQLAELVVLPLLLKPLLSKRLLVL